MISLEHLELIGIRDIWVYIQDVIFWLVAAVIIIASAFIINSGELRGYMLIGYILGACFYMLLFSKFVLSVLGFVFGSIKKFFLILKNSLIKLFKFNPEKRIKKVKVKQEN